MAIRISTTSKLDGIRSWSLQALDTCPGLHGSVIVPTPESLPNGVSLCGAYSHGGKCNGCRACWNREVPVIAYPAHGKKMAKVINIEVAA